MDYFVFRRGQLPSLPPFAVGRPYWDNWLVFQMRYDGGLVIDGSSAIQAVHQSHDYNHVRQRRDIRYHGPEGDRNLMLAGGRDHQFSILDANYWLKPGQGLKPVLSHWRPQRQIELLSARSPRWRPAARLSRRVKCQRHWLQIGANAARRLWHRFRGLPDAARS